MRPPFPNFKERTLKKQQWTNYVKVKVATSVHNKNVFTIRTSTMVVCSHVNLKKNLNEKSKYETHC